MTRLKAHSACFGEVAGWERANWFAPKGVEPKYRYSFKRQNWFDYCAAGVQGDPRAGRRSSTNRPSPNSWCAAPMRRACCSASAPTMSAARPGRAVYTQWLNERGGIEADLTVTRLAEDAYMVVTAAATRARATCSG